jgi:hypothetical protein
MDTAGLEMSDNFISIAEGQNYMNPTKNLIEPNLYMNPTKNLIELNHYMNPTKNLIEANRLASIRFLVGFM